MLGLLVVCNHGDIQVCIGAVDITHKDIFQEILFAELLRSSFWHWWVITSVLSYTGLIFSADSLGHNHSTILKDHEEKPLFVEK